VTAPDTKVRNDEDLLGGTRTNADGSPVKEIVQDDEVVAKIHNDEGLLGDTEANADGSPVLVVTPT
jgi:hypothetical protein